MLRYAVAVDGEAHTVRLQGDVVYVAATEDERNSLRQAVEFWAEGDSGGEDVPRVFQVFGTGHALPEGVVWRGTTARTPQGWVWHLYELPGGTRG